MYMYLSRLRFIQINNILISHKNALCLCVFAAYSQSVGPMHLITTEVSR